MLRELISAGLHRVYFTGGEPLASALASPVLTQLPMHGPDVYSYTLITNGSLVRTHQDLACLHRTGRGEGVPSLLLSNETFRAIARTPIQHHDRSRRHPRCPRDLRAGRVEHAHPTARTSTSCATILDFALDRRMPVQFIELVDTDFNFAP